MTEKAMSIEVETASVKESKSCKTCQQTELWWVELILLLIAGLIPFIMYMRVVSLAGEPMEYWAVQREGWDFFAFYRSRWLILLTIGAWIAWWRAEQPAAFSPAHRWLVVMAAGAIVSTVFSKHPWLAMYGAPDRAEGLPVQLAYLSLAFLALQTAIQRRHTFIPRLFAVLVVCFAAMGTIGALQFLDRDPVRSSLVKSLIIPSELSELRENVAVKLPQTTVYGLFPNPNYTGSFSAMAMAILFGLIWLRPGTKLLPEAGFVGLFWLMFVTWLGCRSKAGLLGGTLGILSIMFFGRAFWRKNLRTAAIITFGALVIFFCMDYRSLKAKNADRLLNNLNTNRISHVQSIPNDFQDLILGTDTFELIFASNRLKCERNPDDGFTFYNRDGKIVPYFWKVQTLVFPPNELRGFLVKIATESKIVQITHEDITLNIAHTTQGFQLLDGLMKPHKLRKIEKFDIFGNDRWGNGRGFIWSRSLPLLWKSLFVGYGPDMFLNHFPQDDFLAKIKAGYPLGWYVDKPHNLYLQIGINTGGISLIAFLALAFGFLWQSARFYWNSRLDSREEIYGLILAAAVVAYLAAGFFNDSVVSVAPLFWIFLGTGIGLLQATKQAGQ